MKHDILILEDFSTEKPGKLFFSRYDDGTPGLFFVHNENILIEFSVDEADFYREYPFGEYRLIVIKDKSAAGTLFELGVVNKPVFSTENEYGTFPVCEISDQVVDLLKEEGRFYV